ncbi:MAG: mannose-6-phosphate isomerase, class I [Bacteroidota bacterium]
MENIYKLKGKWMQYAWGGYDFIPALLGISNADHKPFAEYWMGAHPSAPAELIMGNSNASLYRLCKEQPDAVLSEKVFNRFGELPYLFKVLDVKDILSIQVHPSKKEAENGFDREEAEGIPINAPYRNYKDRNHKPEVMVAISEFWLLHGFKSLGAIESVLGEVPEFNILQPLYRREGLKALYQFVMEMKQPEINAMLGNLIKRELRKKNEGELAKEMPGWWVAKLFAGKAEMGDIDRAVFSLYFFNIVKVNPGEAVFQAAGVPHAYMEGQCMELMANSDNVLRAGLTPKHIDVPELMKHTLFETTVPNIMPGNTVLPGEKIYPCPVPDFGIARIELSPTVSYRCTASSLEILVVMDGGAVVNNSLALKRGEAIAVWANQSYTITASGNAILYKAFVP